MRRIISLLLVVLLLHFTSAALLDDLVAFYQMDETTGDMIDNTGNYNGTVTSVNRGVDGIIREAYNFTSTGQNVQVADTSALRLGQSNFTVSLWFNSFKHASDAYLISKRQNNGQSDYTAFNSDGYLRWFFTPGDTAGANCGSSNIINTTQYLTLGEWYHTAAAFNSNNQSLHIYVNGVQTNVVNFGSSDTCYNWPAAGGPKNLYIGSRHDSNQVGNATIDEIGLWNDTKTAAEINTLYANGLGNTYNFTYPVIDLTIPTNNTEQVKGNMTFNATIISFNQELVNASLYLNGTLNDTVSITGEWNYSVFTVDLGKGLYNWSIISCNNESSCSGSETLLFTMTSLEYSNFTFNNETNEGNTETFSVNVVTPDSLTDAKLWYDGSPYTASITQIATNNYSLSTSLTVPSVAADTNKTFFWQAITSQGQENSTSNNQTVLNYAIDDCSAFTYVLYNFTVVDEISQTQLSGVGDNVDSEVLVEIYDSTKTTLISSFNQSINDKSNYAVCLENNITEDSNQKVDLQVKYGAFNYATEYYNIVSDELTPDDINTKITLYDLDNSTAESFTISYKDSSFLPLEGAVILVQRKYVSEGVFKTVEQPLTDANGETVAHLEPEDAIYTFVILKDGVVEATFNNVLARCPNPAIERCEINLLETSSFVNLLDFSTINGVSFTINYDDSTREVSSLFTILSGSPATMLLNVTLFDAFGSTLVCSNTLVSSSGTLSCTIPSSFGNATVTADVYKDSSHIGRAIIKIGQDSDELYGASLVFLSLMMVMMLVGIGVVGSPIVSAFMLILSAIMLTGFNLIASTGWIGAGATILWFIVAVIIVIIKGANR